MRIAVITCEAYRDAWHPFMQLFEKFWPGCPHPLSFYYDQFPGEQWCGVVERVARDSDDLILLMQEDHFLKSRVDSSVVEYAANLLLTRRAGCIRLYPCPGSDEEIGDELFGIVRKGTVGRISCQAAIWDPKFLNKVAVNSHWTTGEAGDFENLGSAYAETIDTEVLALKRETKEPWPFDYICSGITRGLWNPDALKLFRENNIEFDLSMRKVGE